MNITIFNNQPYDVHFSEATIHIDELKRSYKFGGYYPKVTTHLDMIEVDLEPKDIDSRTQLVHAQSIYIKANRNDTFSIFLSNMG